MALPWLETRQASAAPGGPAPSRFVAIYVPNGMAMGDWTPASVGTLRALPPVLEPLRAHAQSLRVVSGLSTLGLPAVPAYHAAASTRFLTSTSPSSARGAGVRAGMSVDQVVARSYGDATPVRSLELALEPAELVRVCDAQYSCAYQNTIAWANAYRPLPMESRPRAVFERMFGDSSQLAPEARARARGDDRSILESVREGLRSLQQQVSASDRLRLGEYVESIRGVERRIQEAERRAALADQDTRALDEPAGGFVEQYTLIADLMVLALHADVTRVCTLMIGCEASMRSYPQLGVREGHHPLSHHQQQTDALERLARINRLHVQVLAYFLGRLQEVREGDATLRDRTLVLYGAGMSDSHLHRYDNLPVLLAGAVQGGVHVRYPDGTPLANLHVSVLNRFGIPANRFGDSTGALEEL